MRKKDVSQADGAPKPKKHATYENGNAEALLVIAKQNEVAQNKVSVKVSNQPPTWMMMTPEQKKQFLKKVV